MLKLPACRPCCCSQRTITASSPWVTITRPVGVVAEREAVVRALAPPRPAQLHPATGKGVAEVTQRACEGPAAHARRRNHQRPAQQVDVLHLVQPQGDRQRHAGGAVGPVDRVHRVVHDDGPDAGINARVPEGFWDDVLALLREDFSHGRFADGLCKAIGQVGEKLHTLFPYQRDDRNELPNDISFG